eukprot:16441444-Heterocapsa_arctica.AAC.1
MNSFNEKEPIGVVWKGAFIVKGAHTPCATSGSVCNQDGFVLHWGVNNRTVCNQGGFVFHWGVSNRCSCASEVLHWGWNKGSSCANQESHWGWNNGSTLEVFTFGCCGENELCYCVISFVKSRFAEGSWGTPNEGSDVTS